ARPGGPGRAGAAARRARRALAAVARRVMVRGELVRLSAPRRTRGHEQQGARPGVIVQADELLGLSTVLIAPTSPSAAPASFRPLIEVAQTPTRVLTDQLRV